MVSGRRPQFYKRLPSECRYAQRGEWQCRQPTILEVAGLFPNVKKVGASLFQGEAGPASSRADRRVERLPRVYAGHFRNLVVRERTRTAKGGCQILWWLQIRSCDPCRRVGESTEAA